MQLDIVLDLIRRLCPQEEFDAELVQTFYVYIRMRILLELYDGNKETFLLMESYIPPYPDVYRFYIMAGLELAAGRLEQYKVNNAAFENAWKQYREYLFHHEPFDMEAYWTQSV